jgi:hypothetical protein
MSDSRLPPRERPDAMSSTEHDTEVPEGITEEEAAILDAPDDEFDYDGPAAEIDETQLVEGDLVEKDKEWIDWRERVGGEE